MRGDSYLLGALYHVRGNFSLLRSFRQALPFSSEELPYDRDALAEAIDKALLPESRGNDFLSHDQVRKFVINEDLRRVRDELDNPDTVRALDERSDMLPVLKSRLREAANLLELHGIAVGDADIFVVDSFPAPYENRQFAVLAIDAGDQDAYGIQPGLYFHRRSLRPFYSEYLMCHEVVHVILGNKNPELIARGLEEGLAEFIGTAHLSRQMLGAEMTKNIFIYNLLNGEYNPLWEQYLDFTRAAASIYHRYGMEGILRILENGRIKIKEVEGNIFSEQWGGIGLQPCVPQGPDADLVDFLMLAYPRATIMNPLAYYIARYAQAGASVREVAAAARISAEDCMAGLNELSEEFNMVGLREDKSVILWSDCELYTKVHAIRYRL
ncbi:MAG: hypothetical protein J2P31_02125 [Blastocatellia bacterium]|nr:hypothetical protein [Blastocatellia bacterium]